MPPNLPRKRNFEREAHSGSRSQASSSNKRQRLEKPSLFDAADSISRSKGSREANDALLKEIENSEDSTPSDVSEDYEFEDALHNYDVKPTHSARNNQLSPGKHEHDGETVEFEDVISLTTQNPTSTLVAHADFSEASAPTHLELTLDNSGVQQTGSLTTPLGSKKGPSKIERHIRIHAHCMHVQFLLFHNLIRNGWACDKLVQKQLQGQLTPGVEDEIERWRRYCGNALQTDLTTTQNSTPASKRKGQTHTPKTDQLQRDWGKHAAQSDDGVPNLSRGDPTLRLLKVLAAFWRKKFRVTAPGIRKRGYKDMLRLDQEVKAFRKDPRDDLQFGERIQDRAAFRLHAQNLNGSRDVSAQLFTALTRSLGMESRLVTSLQPIGFGWNKNEDAVAAKQLNGGSTVVDTNIHLKTPERSSSALGPALTQPKPKSNNGTQSDSELSSPLSNDDLDSASEVQDNVPSQGRRFDKDLPFPVYWTEVLSPISGVWIPVDPLVLNVVAHKPEQLHLFEARGAKAERMKQITAYVIAFSADGTAKDVTVRYLKKHVWPGKTKGFRIPTEKIPVYSRSGKIKRYEDYNWFKSVMRAYSRHDTLRTAADDVEDSNELQPVRITRENKDTDRRESLQMYKQHPELVLERFLRRDEALVPKAQHIKLFTVGKGENAKNEPVYRREDVVACKTIESWHKEGREVKSGEKPLKMVPVRAVTLLRKREIEEEERETGEKAKQGLYARYQTDWIIPPPIKDGVIPKNGYGNIDIYVPSMVPRGAIHIPLRGSAKICKQLGVNFAEACTGFEFGNKMAVPVIVGVVVAKENKDAVIDAWQTQELQKQKREAEKREKTVLGMWKKMYLGLKVIERFRREYANNAESHMAQAMTEIERKTRSKRLPKKHHDVDDVTKRSNQENVLRRNYAVDDDEGDPCSATRGCPTLDEEPMREHEAEGGFLRDKASLSDVAGPDEREGGFFLGGGDSSSTPVDDHAVNGSLHDLHYENEASVAKRAKLDPEKYSLAEKSDVEGLHPAHVKEARHKQASGATRTTTRRRAAERSIEAVRSHFFDNDSDERSDDVQSE